MDKSDSEWISRSKHPCVPHSDSVNEKVNLQTQVHLKIVVAQSAKCFKVPALETRQREWSNAKYEERTGNIYVSQTEYIFFSHQITSVVTNVMLIPLGSCSCDGSAQSHDYSASCNVRGKRMEQEMMGNGRCEGVEFVQNLSNGEERTTRLVKAEIAGCVVVVVMVLLVITSFQWQGQWMVEGVIFRLCKSLVLVVGGAAGLFWSDTFWGVEIWFPMTQTWFSILFRWRFLLV